LSPEAKIRAKFAVGKHCQNGLVRAEKQSQQAIDNNPLFLAYAQVCFLSTVGNTLLVQENVLVIPWLKRVMA
jgi:hypothetical protein